MTSAFGALGSCLDSGARSANYNPSPCKSDLHLLPLFWRPVERAGGYGVDARKIGRRVIDGTWRSNHRGNEFRNRNPLWFSNRTCRFRRLRGDEGFPGTTVRDAGNPCVYFDLFASCISIFVNTQIRDDYRSNDVKPKSHR